MFWVERIILIMSYCEGKYVGLANVYDVWEISVRIGVSQMSSYILQDYKCIVESGHLVKSKQFFFEEYLLKSEIKSCFTLMKSRSHSCPVINTTVLLAVVLPLKRWDNCRVITEKSCVQMIRSSTASHWNSHCFSIKKEWCFAYR